MYTVSRVSNNNGVVASSSKYFALKVLSMHDVIRLKQVEHVKNEKRILSEVSHPFVVDLVWSSRDANRQVFFVS